MYSLLIIEDEPLERMALKYLVEDSFPEIKMIWEAENGVTALKLARQYKPDILLVDINIPGLSGLALIQALVEQYYEGKILITTAYDRFDYAKEALELGAMGYLLKPIQDSELAHFLHKCFATIDYARNENHLKEVLNQEIKTVRSYAQTYLIGDLLSGNITKDILYTAYGWPQNGDLQARVLRFRFPEETSIEEQNIFILDCKEIFTPEFRMISLIMDQEAVVIVQSSEVREENYLYVATWVYSMTLLRKLWYRGNKLGTLNVSGLCHTSSELQQVLQSKVLQLKNMNIQPAWKVLINIEPMDTNRLYSKKEWKKIRQRLVQRIREGQHRRISSNVMRLVSKPNAFWSGILLFLEAMLKYDEQVYLPGVFQALTANIPNNNSLDNWLKEYFKQSELTKNQRDERPEGYNNLIQTALEIMRTRFHTDLSQSMVAEELGLSQSYFSRLFKKVEGCNFIEAITAIRVEHAKRLIQIGENSIDQIAYQCGFHNKKYFLDVFKKSTGVSITQYKNIQ